MNLKKMKNNLWKFSALILIAEIHIVSSLQNVAVLEGSSLELKCNSDERDEVEWYFRGVGLIPKYDQRIYSTARPHPTDDSLSIQPVNLSHAGTYICHVISPGGNDDAVQTRIFYSQLVVIDSHKCSSESDQSDLNILEGATVPLQCGISFRGNWYPIIEWTKLDRYNISRKINTTAEVESVGNGITITSHLTFIADSSVHESRFVCTIRFGQMPNTVLSNASNIPEYIHVCTTKTFHVSYISPNISIIPVRNIYHPGDNVSCATDANPSPVYHWKNLQTGVVSSGSHVVLEVPTDHIPVCTYVCTVRYAVVKFNISRTFERIIIVTKRPTSSEIPGMVRYDKDAISHSLMTTLIIVSVVMSLLALIMFLGCIHRWRLNEETKKSSVSDVNSSDRYEEIDLKDENDDLTMSELSKVPYYENSKMFPAGGNNCVANVNYPDQDVNEIRTSTMVHRGDRSPQPNVTVPEVDDDNYTSNIERNMTPQKPAFYSKLLMNGSKPSNLTQA